MFSRLIRVGVVLALAAGLWLELGLVANGSLYSLLLHDPWHAILDQRDLALTRGRLRNSPTLVFFGDSTCDCIKSDDAADGAVPPLGQLVQHRLCGPTGLLPKAWKLEQDCGAGGDGYSFETVVSGMVLSANPPKAAIFVVNLRSLNSLGFNGFPGDGGAAPSPPHASNFSVKHRSRAGFFEGFRDAVHYSRPAAVLRGLTGWSREGLVNLITPATFPDPNAPPRPEQLVRTDFKRVYGDGYALNQKILKALIGAGDLLAARGCKALYYITPVDRVEVARDAGPDVLRQLDAGAARAANDLRQAGYPVLDLHALLDHGFIDPPSEHLAAAGREAVARRLSAWAYGQLFPKSGAH